MKVSLFITCLADTFFPEVGEAVVRTLRRCGVEVGFPEGQTCCGQPAWNSGHHREAAVAARQLVRSLRDSEYVVTPSGSCAAMVRHYFSQLFENDPHWRNEAASLASRLYEFSEFMVRVLGITDLGARFPARATVHPSCHMTRGLGLRDEPKMLLEKVAGLELVELPYAQDCCGFGGTFAVKMAEMSEAMVDEKASHVVETGAEVLIGTDMACLMHIGGRLRRQRHPVRVMHLAQVLDEGVRGR